MSKVLFKKHKSSYINYRKLDRASQEGLFLNELLPDNRVGLCRGDDNLSGYQDFKQAKGECGFIAIAMLSLFLLGFKPAWENKSEKSPLWYSSLLGCCFQPGFEWVCWQPLRVGNNSRIDFLSSEDKVCV